MDLGYPLRSHDKVYSDNHVYRKRTTSEALEGSASGRSQIALERSTRNQTLWSTVVSPGELLSRSMRLYSLAPISADATAPDGHMFRASGSSSSRQCDHCSVTGGDYLAASLPHPAAAVLQSD